MTTSNPEKTNFPDFLSGCCLGEVFTGSLTEAKSAIMEIP
jgi:hypothetical protein